MKKLICLVFISTSLFAQSSVGGAAQIGVSIQTGGVGGGVSQVVIAGTANNLAVAGTCTITTTGTCTLSVPWATATTGTFTLANGKTLTVSNTLTFTGTDSSTVAFGAGGTVLYVGGTYVASLGGLTGVVGVAAGIKVSGSNIVFDDTVLSGLVPFLGTVNNAYTTQNTFTPTATLAGLRSACTTLPSAPNGGSWMSDGSCIPGHSDGTNSNVIPTLAGVGAAYPTAPTSGHNVRWGASYKLTTTGSATWATADIANNAITAAKMAATTWDAQTDGATITWAIASILNAQATVTLGGNRTLNITNPVVGGNYVFRITQDGTGTRTLTKGTGCTWKELGSSASTFGLSTAIGAIDVLTFTYDGTNCLANVGKAYGG